MIARRRATSMSHTAGCMRRSRRCCALALLALVCATTSVLAAAKGCACPRKGDDLDAWLQCIGLDEEERERLMSEGWQAEDLVEMPLDDAESALRMSRAKAWRIARCNGKEDARGRPSHSDLQLATYPEPDGEIGEQHAALEDDGGQFSAAESRHSDTVGIGKVEERRAEAKAPSESSNSREGGEHQAREVRGRGTAEMTWDGTSPASVSCQDRAAQATIARNAGVEDAQYYTAEYRAFRQDHSPHLMRPGDVLEEPLICIGAAPGDAGIHAGSCDMTKVEITVVVGVYKRPETFSAVTDSIVASTARVKRLWIVCNGSPYEETFRAKTEELAARMLDEESGIEVSFFSTNKEIGYYERFLRALVVDTKYMAFIDDDMVIGRRFLEVCLHALHTRRYYGLVGIVGPQFPEPERRADDTHVLPDCRRDYRFERRHFHNTPSALTDILYNVWVGETSMFRLIFRDAPMTLKTGEDFTLSHAVQHFGKLRCLILDSGDPSEDDGDEWHEFCGDCVKELKWINRSWWEPTPAEVHLAAPRASEEALAGYASEDAVRDHTALRQLIMERLWRRGWPIFLTRAWKSRPVPPSLLAVADVHQAELALEHGLIVGLDRRWLLLGGGSSGGDAAAVAESLGLHRQWEQRDMRIFELSFSVRVTSFPVLFAEVLTGAQAVIEACKPNVVIVLDDGSIPSAATATAASLLGVAVTRVGSSMGPESKSRVVSDILHTCVASDILHAVSQEELCE
jgi:hypothetical protein